ncbi:flagellar export chaperone FlgN [Nitrospira sp. MA-1]|nr:flagellar export chaperone FlgN [Nitrospira sp. MA-1]
MNHPQSAKWERLLKALAEAQAAFQQYGVLLFQEAHSLRIMDQPKLVEVNSQKEQVLNSMRRLEKQVEGALHQLVGDVAQETIWTWLKANPDPQAQTVQSMLIDLRRLARLIQEQGKKNESAIRPIYHRVCEAIQVMYTGLGTGPVYQGSGTLYFPSVPSSVYLQG